MATYYIKLPYVPGGSGAVDSVNGQTGIVVLTPADLGLGNVNNTSDADKPISTATQAALDNKQDTILGNDNEVVYQNDSGDIETFPGLTRELDTGGLQLSLTVVPNGLSGNYQLKPSYISILPAQDSPDQAYTLYNNQINHDGGGFEFGSNGDSFTFLNNNFVANFSGDLGRVSMISNSFSIGDGITPTNIKGVGYSFGFGQINAEVTVTDFLQGYGFQPFVHADAILDPNSFINAFYDYANIETLASNYTSIGLSPNIAGIINNHGYTAININTTIDEFQGNAGYNGLGISGNLGTFDTGGYNGININPTIDSVRFATGISVSMDNVTVFPGANASLVIQDLTITADQPGVTENTVTFEYTGGGTAGAEVVSNTGLSFQVQIEDGVSTAQNIADALNAYLFFTQNLNVTVSGTASNPQSIQAPTNLTGGEDPGNKKAASFDGDVEITGSLTFGGALSIGKLNAFYQQELSDGGGNPQSVHLLISAPFIGDNETVNNADLIGLNTAMLLTVGDNSTVNSAFLGLSALALPAVVSIGSGSTVDRVAGATFALSLDATAGGGSIDILDLCRSIAIPNGVTTVNKMAGYKMDLPFGNPATTAWGFYEQPGVNNYFAGNLLIGGTAGSDDTVTNSSVALEIKSTTKALVLPRMTTTERNALTAIAGMLIFNTSLSSFEGYDGSTWVSL